MESIHLAPDPSGKACFAALLKQRRALIHQGTSRLSKKDTMSAKGWTFRKMEKAWQASKKQCQSMINSKRDKHRCQEKPATNRIPESEIRLLWKHPGLKIRIRIY